MLPLHRELTKVITLPCMMTNTKKPDDSDYCELLARCMTKSKSFKKIIKKSSELMKNAINGLLAKFELQFKHRALLAFLKANMGPQGIDEMTLTRLVGSLSPFEKYIVRRKEGIIDARQTLINIMQQE